ncbi:MAG: DUF4386 domain-containing protein [Leptospiraceae bacterium]|nr:DUF4386 domain-containing protein [Leptospiraceae bacterium]
MQVRQLSILTGISYLVIFFAAIFANFVVLESLKTNPVQTVTTMAFTVRIGIMAFLITVVCDVVVAWTLWEIYNSQTLNRLSTLFRLMHAALMGVAIYYLPAIPGMTDAELIQSNVQHFEIIWLIGLFFFGVHLILLARIFHGPLWIRIFLAIAGLMYMIDTSAHILLQTYQEYAIVFLTLVAVPSMLGEMAFAIWLLLCGGKNKQG